MNKLFVDTSAWIAHFNRDDDFHKEAERIFVKRPDLITSNTVLHETVAHLSARVSKKAAEIAGDFILFSGVVELITVSFEDELAAWKKYKSLHPKISYVDATNAVVMNKLRLKDSFAFDRDFLDLGFKLIP